MKQLLLTYIVILGVLFTACNDMVFVQRPEPEEPPVEEPDPGAEPEFEDSLMLKSLVYDKSTLRLEDEEIILDATSTFSNHTESWGVTVLYDNYNKSIVTITNSTYYVTPWAKNQDKHIEVPGLDSDGVPGFYGTEIPFSFGTTVIPRQYMAGHMETFDLPPHCKVSATIYTTFRSVTAKADIEYFMTSFPSSIENGWVKVTVWVPVDIRVEWSEVTPAE